MTLDYRKYKEQKEKEKQNRKEILENADINAIANFLTGTSENRLMERRGDVQAKTFFEAGNKSIEERRKQRQKEKGH